MKVANLLDHIPAALPAEWSEALLTRASLRIERIVSRGHGSPEGFWYDQDWDEWVLVVKGRAGLIFAGQEEVVVLGAGDHLFIAAHARHRVAWTDPSGPTVWLAVHLRPETDQGPEEAI